MVLGESRRTVFARTQFFPTPQLHFQQESRLTLTGTLFESHSAMKIRWIAILSFATLCLIGPLTVRADFRGAAQAAKVRDWAKVLQECQSDAQSGEKNCQSHLGFLYKSGLGVEKNLPLSIEFLTKCAAQQQMYCEEQVKDEAVELQRVLDDLKAKNAKFALAIIDACRDNPFKQSGRAIGGRGLAPTTAATGQMIMFSAGAGQQALDKLGSNDPEKNGVFTRVLLKEMTKPGIAVDRVLRNVRNEVVRLSKSIGHEQTPALYDQAVGDFYFALK